MEAPLTARLQLATDLLKITHQFRQVCYCVHEFVTPDIGDTVLTQRWEGDAERQEVVNAFNDRLMSTLRIVNLVIV